MKKNIKQKKNYNSPKIQDLGNAKSIIKSVFTAGTGDTQPGMSLILASS
tara:strand:- start:168 stop:314 length:147 start_codon:yes stop_codon:yes gene_type:complete